jgi:hypothetical protein
VLWVSDFLPVLYLQRPGGHGVFQIPTLFTGKYHHFGCDLEASIKEGGMQMHYLEVDQVTKTLQQRGCSILGQYLYDAISVASFGEGSTSHIFLFSKDLLARPGQKW